MVIRLIGCGLFEWKQICTGFLLLVYTVKPVYKGHSREPKNVPIMSSAFYIQVARTKFTKAFLDISELCIPKREVTIRSNDKLWFVSILRKEIRKRDRLWEIISLT